MESDVITYRYVSVVTSDNIVLSDVYATNQPSILRWCATVHSLFYETSCDATTANTVKVLLGERITKQRLLEKPRESSSHWL